MSNRTVNATVITVMMYVIVSLGHGFTKHCLCVIANFVPVSWLRTVSTALFCDWITTFCGCALLRVASTLPLSILDIPSSTFLWCSVLQISGLWKWFVHFLWQQWSAVYHFIMLRGIYVPSVLWCCWLGSRKGIRPVKSEWWGAGMVICLERGADLHLAQLMPLPLTVSCFGVPAHPSSPRQSPSNVCVYVSCLSYR